ncbi:MAG: hypothetical protein K1X88_28725, partial [Nannocystaceae bacterium]|nr:hypothetical protein [Nannocystaceae bacterium]
VHDIATNEGANRVAINDAGAVALVGTIFNETYDALTIGVDVEGTVEWAAMYDGPGTEPSNFDRGNGAAIDAAGNIYASGRSVELDEENHVWIRRYDVGGAIAWTLTGDDTTLGVATASVFGADGLDIVGTRPASAFVTRYDEAGAVQWDQDVVGDILCNDNCGFTQVDATDDGGVVAAGIVAGPGGGEVYVARFDTAGEPVWVQSIASATDATIRGIDGFESSVRVLVSGDTDHEVRSYDDAGDLEWTLDAPASVLATHVAGASDGDLFLAAADGDAVVVERIAIDGTAIWSVNHPAPDSATAPVLSGIAFGAGRVVLAGAVTVAGQSDVWAVAISQ